MNRLYFFTRHTLTSKWNAWDILNVTDKSFFYYFEEGDLCGFLGFLCFEKFEATGYKIIL